VAEVITGEAVVIDVPFARFPSRTLALIIDLVIQLVLLFGLSGVALAAGAGGGLDAAAVTAISLAVSVLIIVGYPALFETLSRGRSLGKLALGLRVVSDDGGPERFRQALMRALMAVLEIWLTLGFLALVTSLLSSGGKRLGDIFAGTFVITERLPGRRGTTAPLSALPPALAAWAATAELSGLDDGTAETVRQYLSRYYDFTPATREEFGHRLAAAVARQVTPPPPPGASPPDYLSAVLAERRDRAHARIAAQASMAAPTGTSPPPAPVPPPPSGAIPAGAGPAPADPAPADPAPAGPAPAGTGRAATAPAGPAPAGPAGAADDTPATPATGAPPAPNPNPSPNPGPAPPRPGGFLPPR
jgi:uncharacterized RDD family membrane protein YckC